MDPNALSLFDVDEPALARSLAHAMGRGADYADLYFQHRRTTRIVLEDGLVSLGASGVDRGVGVRAVVGDQTGYAFSEALDERSIERAARTAASIAESGAAVPPRGFAALARPDLYAGTSEAGVAEKAALLKRVEALVRAADPAIVKVSVQWSDEDDRVLVVTSDGTAAFDRRPMSVLAISVTAERDGERQTNRVSRAGRRGLEWFTDALVEEACREVVARTRILFEARRPPAGEMPVVLAAGASGILLHEAIGHGMEADFNRKGVSIYASLMDRRVASPEVTIVDSALHPHERGALNVDDEGNATEETVLVEDGVLRTYLHDRISAKRYGRPSTGSGRRQSFRHAPLPRMRCTYLRPGPRTREEIVASVDRGILAETFLNGQVQIGAGDFTFYLKNGWLIEGGRITAPIKDVNVIGNGPDALRAITMVGDDLEMDRGGWTCGKEGQSVPVSQGMPTTLVSSLTVGGDDA
jgi:TldD protein